MNKLREYSINLIKANQHISGSYIASPNFENYSYSWIRDGSFIAYSMLISGETQSAYDFLVWVHNVIVRYKDNVEKIRTKISIGEIPDNFDYLPTRYTLDGVAAKDDWPNFQIDGYGTWLWVLSEYISLTGDVSLLAKFQFSIRATINYLKLLWDKPNYDCWEENGDKIHPATLACIYGGIKSINEFLGEKELQEFTESIKEFVLENAVENNRFTKYVGSNSVDSSLLWLSVPFGLISPENPLMSNTVKAIEESIYSNGGVKRYPEDTYYGGGQWILLSCWLGWYYLKVGQVEKTRKILKWVVDQADDQMNLPEQVLTETNNPEYIEHWEKMWGKVAKPLLWSHAMYLVLLEEKNKFGGREN